METYSRVYFTEAACIEKSYARYNSILLYCVYKPFAPFLLCVKIVSLRREACPPKACSVYFN